MDCAPGRCTHTPGRPGTRTPGRWGPGARASVPEVAPGCTRYTHCTRCARCARRSLKGQSGTRPTRVPPSLAHNSSARALLFAQARPPLAAGGQARARVPWLAPGCARCARCARRSLQGQSWARPTRVTPSLAHNSSPWPHMHPCPWAVHAHYWSPRHARPWLLGPRRAQPRLGLRLAALAALAALGAPFGASPGRAPLELHRV